MLPFASQSGSRRPVHFQMFLALLALASFSRPASAGPTTVELPDADGQPWEIVINPAAGSFVTTQPELPLVQSDEAAIDIQPADADAPRTYENSDAAASGDAPARAFAEPRIIRTEEHGVEIVAAENVGSIYSDIYRSIPFSRAEYEAYPSYRHDTAMELLTGKPHPPRCPTAAPPYAPGLPFGPAAFPYGAAAYPYYPLYGYRPYIPTFAYRVFPYPAFGYRSRYRYYPVAGFGYGLNYGLWY